MERGLNRQILQEKLYEKPLFLNKEKTVFDKEEIKKLLSKKCLRRKVARNDLTISLGLHDQK